MFNCKMCSPRDKRIQGCKKSFKYKAIWVNDFCPDCEGFNKKCKLCKGTGSVVMSRCLYRQAEQGFKLLKYYRIYKEHGRFPDGKGQLHQPVSLIEAFHTLEVSIEKIQGKKENGSRTQSQNNSK